MGSVYKRKGRDGRPLGNYTISFRDHTGRLRCKSARTSDKRTAQRILRQHEDRVAQIRAGLIDARLEERQRRSQEPICEAQERYLDQFGKTAKRRGRGKRSATTIRDERNNLKLILQHELAAGFLLVADLEDALALVRPIADKWSESGLTGRTINKRIGSMRRFLDWCRRDGLLQHAPLEEWATLAEEPTRERRPLSEEEVERLLAVARERGREAGYLVAVRTGLRRSEMARLTWGDLELEAELLNLPGSKSKSRRGATLPLTADVAAALRSLMPELAHPTARVFTTIPTNVTRRKDFLRAGIVLVDEQGRHADLHGLRMTLGTQLAQRGVSVQVQKDFMRHSDYRTTSEHYVRLGISDLEQARTALEEGSPLAPARQRPATGS